MSAEKNIYTHLHLRGNELRGFVFERLESDPDPIDGRIYYNVAKNEFRACISGVWVNIFSIWHVDDDGNITTDKQVIIKNNLIVEEDTGSGGDGEDTVTGIIGVVIDGVTYRNTADGLLDLSDAFDNVSVDLSNYYTKSQVDAKIQGIDLNLYATKTYVDNKVSAVTSEVYTKSQMDNLLGKYVTLSTAQTISGAKTFTALLTATGGMRITGDVEIDGNLIVTGDTASGDEGEEGEEGGGTGIIGLKVNGETYKDKDGSGIITIPDYPTSLTWTAISGKPSFAKVATSGRYADLTDQPTIPTLQSLMVENSIGSATEFIYWYNEQWNTRKLGDLAFRTEAFVSWSEVDSLIDSNQAFNFINDHRQDVTRINLNYCVNEEMNIERYYLYDGYTSLAELHAKAFVVNESDSKSFIKADGSLDDLSGGLSVGGSLSLGAGEWKIMNDNGVFTIFLDINPPITPIFIEYYNTHINGVLYLNSITSDYVSLNINGLKLGYHNSELFLMNDVSTKHIVLHTGNYMDYLTGTGNGSSPVFYNTDGFTYMQDNGAVSGTTIFVNKNFSFGNAFKYIFPRSYLTNGTLESCIIYIKGIGTGTNNITIPVLSTSGIGIINQSTGVLYGSTFQYSLKVYRMSLLFAGLDDDGYAVWHLSMYA